MGNVIDAADFDVATFIQKHPDSYIVFVTGGWDYISKNAYYECLLCFGCYRKKIERRFENMKSPNAAMLYGVIDACVLLKKEKMELFVITPTALGFKKGVKGKGANVEIVQAVLELCEKKEIQIHDFSLKNGGQLIRDIIKEKL